MSKTMTVVLIEFGLISAEAWIASAQPLHQPMLGNSAAGEKFLLGSGCVGCHRLRGSGSTRGTDLAVTNARSYSSTDLVAVLWNHQNPTPTTRPHFSQADLGNLFAYAVSRRYFDEPGDAARGKRVFVGKGCAGCHGISAAAVPGVPPVTAWTALSDAVAFAADLWNHAPQMRALETRRRIRWMELSPQEMADLLLYLRSLPPLRRIQLQFSTGADDGQRLFEVKRCAACHGSGWTRRHPSGRITPEGFASSMSNHRVSAAKEKNPLTRDEMRALFSYLWSSGYLEDRASPRRGRRLFESKGCSSCHGDFAGRPDGSEAPRLRLGELDRMTAITALLNHAPAMADAAQRQGTGWPRLKAKEMRDLLAFLSGAAQR